MALEMKAHCAYHKTTPDSDCVACRRVAGQMVIYTGGNYEVRILNETVTLAGADDVTGTDITDTPLGQLLLRGINAR